MSELRKIAEDMIDIHSHWMIYAFYMLLIPSVIPDADHRQYQHEKQPYLGASFYIGVKLLQKYFKQ